MPSAWVLMQPTRMARAGETLHEAFPPKPGKDPPTDGGRKPQGPLRFAAPARRLFCSAMEEKQGYENARTSSERVIEEGKKVLYFTVHPVNMSPTNRHARLFSVRLDALPTTRHWPRQGPPAAPGLPVLVAPANRFQGRGTAVESIRWASTTLWKGAQPGPLEHPRLAPASDPR